MTAPAAKCFAGGDPADRVRLVHDAATGVGAIHARFGAHAYDLHRHAEWLVGVTDHGVQDFLCRGARRRSTPGRVILIEPEEAHDGQAGAAGGFSYQMLYLPQHWLRDALAGAAEGASAPRRQEGDGFRGSLCDDAPLGTTIRRACRLLLHPAERLLRDAALDAVLDALRPQLGHPLQAGTPYRAPGGLAFRQPLRAGADRSNGAAGHSPWPGGRRAASRSADPVARRARDVLHEAFAADPGADALARQAGAANRFHLARAFRASFNTSPHAYLVQLRLGRARALLAAGEAPAAVAAACGFADQSHLGRRFRSAYGLTPARFRALCTDVPDGALPG